LAARLLGDQKVCTSGGFKFQIYYSKLFENTCNGTIKDSTVGFTIVLACRKAYLEHNIDLNLIMDKFPKELMQHGN